MRQASGAVNELAGLLSGATIITAEMYGAVGDGVTDDGPAIQRAFDAGHKSVWLSYKNYLIATTITFPSYAVLRSDERAILTKGANIDLFDMSAQACRLQGLNIQGAGATYTGRGAYITGNYDQRIVDCDLIDFSGYCLEFIGSDSGQRFEATNSNFLRTVADNAAIKMPSVIDATAGNRTFTGCGTIGGGRLFDLDSAANTGIVNCQFVTLTMSSNTSRSRIVGNRIAALGGTVTIDGFDNLIADNVIAGNLQIAATSQRCVVGPNSLLAGGSVTDLSNATGDNMNYVYASNGLPLTPVWGQTSGTGPVLGNGSLSALLYRNGRQYTVRISLLLGSTTTTGDSTGNWTFELPSPYNRLTKAAASGSVRGIDTAANVNRTGTSYIASGSSKIFIPNNATNTGWKGTVPHSWVNGDSLDLTIAYEIG